MDIKSIESLARLMKENALTSLELTQDGVSLKLERVNTVAPAQALTASPFSPAPVEPDPPPTNGTLVLSPTVGVFYAAPAPDSPPFVEAGAKVRKGDTLCIIEAMKLMNEIPAEIDGTVAEICVGNGQVVEYNQPLFRIVP